jgi:hypothetical protein
MADRALNSVEEGILKWRGIDSRVVKPQLMAMYQKIGHMESDNNLKAANKDSSARGVYQYLNDNKTGPDGQRANSSFETALNRLGRAYGKMANEEIPEWVLEAKRHQDPTKLSREQSDTLMLSDMLLGDKPATPLFDQYLIHNDDQALADLYSTVHHTDTAGQPGTEERMKRIFGKAPSR